MRSHNEGSYFQRKTGKDKGSWVSVVTMRDGRRPTRTTHSRDEAKAALTELLRLRDAGAPFTGRVRLGDYLERWVSDGTTRMAPATRRKHEAIARVHVVPALGHIRLSELSVGDVERAVRGLDLGPQSRRHVRATLRRALADAVRDGLVTRNVAGLARPDSLGHTERTILDATQARLLIESTRGTRYGPLWTILVTTGLRISEALGLAWSDVDFGGTDESRGQDLDLGRGARLGSPRPRGRDSAGVGGGAGERPRGVSLTVRHQLARENGEWVRRPPKTAKGRRTIPLTPLGVEALRAQREQQRQDRGALSIDGLVFTSSKGHPLHGENTGKQLYADLAAAGLPRVTQHDLRHSCATLLFAAGVPLPVISDILGHSTTRITADLYRHHIPALSVAAAERMQEALSG